MFELMTLASLLNILSMTSSVSHHCSKRLMVQCLANIYFHWPHFVRIISVSKILNNGSVFDEVPLCRVLKSRVIQDWLDVIDHLFI